MTLGDRLAGRDNALNAIRLGLALLVITSHTFPLGGFGPDPLVGYQLGLGGWAVVGFFAISGYLIPISRSRQTPARYAHLRAARILPGLWVCLAVTSFVFAPIAAVATDFSYDPASALTYVLQNLTGHVGQRGIGDELAGVQSTFWNGAIWTIFFELACYVIVGVLLTSSTLRSHQTATAAALFVGSSVAYPMTGWNLPYFLTFFAAGWLIGANRHRITPTWTLTGLCAALGLILGWVPYAPFALPLGLALLCVGALSPVRLFATNDVSYGVYLYGFPTQQLLAVLGVPALGVVAYMTASLTVALGLGAASWFLLERRFLPKRLGMKRPPTSSPRFGGRDRARWLRV